LAEVEYFVPSYRCDFFSGITHQQGYSIHQQTVKNVSKLDIVFDAYQLNSLKGTTIKQPGQGF